MQLHVRNMQKETSYTISMTKDALEKIPQDNINSFITNSIMKY